MPLRCVIFERISIDKEDIQNQDIMLLQKVKIEGWELVHEPFRLSEHGDVGQRWEEGKLLEDRAELREILTLAKQRTFDILLVWHHDRLTRAGGTSLMNYVRQFASLGVSIYDYSKNDFLKDDGKSTTEIVMNLEGFGAKVYKEEVVRKTQNKIDLIKTTIKNQGFYVTRNGRTITNLGRTPMKAAGGRLLTEVDIVKIKELRGTGMSLRQIAAEMGCSTTPIQKILKTK